MLLKASLKNGDWNLVKEIMRFISSIDPADFENDVFDFQPDPNSTNKSENNHTPLSFKLSKSAGTPTSNRNSASAVMSLSPVSKKVAETPKALNTSTSSSSKQRRISMSELELSKKSIESTIYEYALELIKSCRIKKLFEMFSNLNFLNISKWLEQYQ